MGEIEIEEKENRKDGGSLCFFYQKSLLCRSVPIRNRSQFTDEEEYNINPKENRASNLEEAMYHLAGVDEEGIAEAEEEVALGGAYHGADGAGEDGAVIGGEEAVPDGVVGGGGAEGGGDGGEAADVAGGGEGDGVGDAALGKPIHTRLTHSIPIDRFNL